MTTTAKLWDSSLNGFKQDMDIFRKVYTPGKAGEEGNREDGFQGERTSHPSEWCLQIYGIEVVRMKAGHQHSVFTYPEL